MIVDIVPPIIDASVAVDVQPFHNLGMFVAAKLSHVAITLAEIDIECGQTAFGAFELSVRIVRHDSG